VQRIKVQKRITRKIIMVGAWTPTKFREERIKVKG
jgi:hypothetical protein